MRVLGVRELRVRVREVRVLEVRVLEVRESRGGCDGTSCHLMYCLSFSLSLSVH